VDWSPHVALIVIVVLMATERASAGGSRRSGMKIRRTPLSADTVVWLDFSKRRYYSRAQKLYASGFRAASSACRRRAAAGNRRSLLGLR